MPITVVCTNCGRTYAADDSLAGRRVRCRGCGEIVQIPLSDEAGGGFDPPDLGTFGGQGTFTDDALLSTQMNYPPGAEAGFDQPPAPGLPAGMEEVEVSAAGIEAAGRANFRYNFLGAKTVDDLLPWALVIGSLVWFVVQTSRNDNSGVPWITATRVVLPLLLFTVLVCPLVYTSLRAAGRSVGFQLPRTARWRTFACYLPAMTLTAALWMMGSGTLVSFVMGVLAGLLLASGCLWILFRLKPEEAPPTAAYAAVGFVIGAVASAAILTGLNMVVRSVVESTNAVAAVPASPLGSGFDWVDPSKLPPPPTGRPAGGRTTATPTHTAPGSTDAAAVAQPTEPVTPPPTAADEPPTGADATAGTPDVAPPPVAAGSDSTVAPVPAPNGGETTAQPTPPPPPPTDAAAAADAPKSPLVASFTVAPLDAPADAFVTPMTPSPYVAAVRREGDVITVTLWQGDPWQKKGQARFSAAAGIGDRIAISPDGAFAARLASFPSTAIQVWSFADNRELARIPLNTSMGTPEIVGFLTADRIVVQWSGAADGATVLDFFDVKAGARAREPLRLNVAVQGEHSIAFSPNGAFFAVAAKAQGEPTLLFYAFAGERPARSVKIRMLDPRWPLEPTGMAFAPDVDNPRDNVVGMMFEQSGVALVVAYRQDGMVVGERVYDPGPPAPRPPGFDGSALRWLAADKKRWWLVYGQAVIDPSTGAPAGTIDLLDVEQAHNAGGPAMLFVSGRDRGRRAPAHAKIDLSSLAR